MADGPVLPNVDSYSTMVAAIAYEIVRSNQDNNGMVDEPRLVSHTNAVIRAIKALKDGVPLPEPKK